jgi:hypothetical protein
VDVCGQCARTVRHGRALLALATGCKRKTFSARERPWSGTGWRYAEGGAPCVGLLMTFYWSTVPVRPRLA